MSMEGTVPCAECGERAPREEMFGYGEDLRCPECAAASRRRLVPARHRALAPALPPLVTAALGGAALAATVPLLAAGSDGIPAWLAWLSPTAGIRAGEVWRLATSTLIHGSVLHLLFNVWWLWDFGRAIEGRWGHAAMVALWLGLGLSSGAVQWFAEGPGIGLSGVVYGLWGMLFALRKTRDFAARAAQPRVNQIFVFWFVLCVLLSGTGTWRIANWAHGAGAAFGFVLGRAIDAPKAYRRVLVVLLGLLALGLAAATALLDPL